MISFQDLFTLLNLEELSRLTLCDTNEFVGMHVPPFAPDIPALLHNVSGYDLDSLQKVLKTTYADDHIFDVVFDDKKVTQIALGLLATIELDAPVDAIYIPPMHEGTSLTAFRELIAHLRAPDGCPWDRKQTHQTLRKHMLEEAYEALDAMDQGNSLAMAEEFGDLLLQIVLNAQIAVENGNFAMSDIIKGIYDKIVRRHPHVFGEVEVDGEEDVLQNWEALKAEERQDKGEKEKGILDGVPLSFPALNQAQEYQDRAARVGFDWPVIDGVLDKVIEEIEEIQQAKNDEELASEIGDLFFVLVNFARWKSVDAESALREANKRFRKRFGYIEQNAREMEHPIPEMTLDEMEELWQEAKKNGL